MLNAFAWCLCKHDYNMHFGLYESTTASFLKKKNLSEYFQKMVKYFLLSYVNNIVTSPVIARFWNISSSLFSSDEWRDEI